MEESTRYFLEFLPRIRAVQVSLSNNCPRRVTFRSSSLSSREGCQGETETVLCQWAEPELYVSSYLDLRVIPGEAVHVRFKTEPLGRGGDHSNVLKLDGHYTGAPSNPVSGEIPKGDAPLVARCSFCCNTLTKGGSPFKRILPLPSDHWNEFTGNIFCHAHQQCHVNVQHSSLGLQPREEDCLISKSFILLRSSALDFDRGVLLNQRRTVGTLEVSELLCKRCISCLGRKTSDDGSHTAKPPDGESCNLPLPSGHIPTLSETSADSSTSVLKLQRCWILLEGRSGEEGRSFCSEEKVGRSLGYEEDRLARTLYSTSKERMSFRFIVQDDEERPHLCLCLLNAVSRVICNSYPADAASALGKFSGLIAPSLSPSSSSSTSSSSSSPTTSTSSSSTHPPSHCDSAVLKVLFKHTMATKASSQEKEDETIHFSPSQWYKDSTVDVLQLSTEESLRLALLLADSNRTFPPSQRVANGFRVGFLRLLSSLV